MIKGINKKQVEHNLRFELKDAVFKGDKERAHKAAQNIVDAGYELEDMKYGPAVFETIATYLYMSGWTPK